MKTRIIATLASILISTSIIIANANTATLTFYDAHGNELTMPVMMEAEEDLPFELKATKESTTASLHQHVFDISLYSNPEQEDELPFEIKMLKKIVKPSLSQHVFDISLYSHPEQEDELPFHLKPPCQNIDR